jgi:hypothetical protein
LGDFCLLFHFPGWNLAWQRKGINLSPLIPLNVVPHILMQSVLSLFYVVILITFIKKKKKKKKPLFPLFEFHQISVTHHLKMMIDPEKRKKEKVYIKPDQVELT